MLTGKYIIAVAAMDENRAIGNKGKLPDRNAPEDMAFFRSEITGKTIIMGRKTYESIYSIYKDKSGHPLAKNNIILTHHDIPGAITATSIEQVVQYCKDEKLLVIGGAEIYKLFLPYTDTILLTKIHGTYEGDTFFPVFESEFELQEIHASTDNTCDFCRYSKLHVNLKGLTQGSSQC